LIGLSEVGDLIRVTLRNNARFAFSLHAHGNFGNKANEGIRYNDNTQGYFKYDDQLDAFGRGARDCTQSGWAMSTKGIDYQANASHPHSTLHI